MKKSLLQKNLLLLLVMETLRLRRKKNPVKKNPLRIMHKTKLVGRAGSLTRVMRVEQEGRQNNIADALYSSRITDQE